MSIERTTGATYERGLELRARAVVLLGGSARLGSELGSSTEISFNLGRGEYRDEQGPRSLSLDLQSRGTFLIRRANKIAENQYNILTMKNTSTGDFSADSGIQLKHQNLYPNGRGGRVTSLPINPVQEQEHLELIDTDLDLVKIILDSQV